MPYTNCAIVASLKKYQVAHQPLKLAFLDVDGTLTGTPEEQVAVRALLEQQGYHLVFVTHRSSELCMSRTPGTNADEFQGLLDPAVIAGKLGNEIVVRQNDGTYRVDEAYAKPVGSVPNDWPAHKQEAVDRIFGTLCSWLSADPKKFQVLLAGDSLPDLLMGLFSAAGTTATFVVPGGASLTGLLFSPEFATRYPLQLTGKGVYHFSPTTRTVIIGDEALPGTTGPTTLQACLKTLLVL